MKKSIVSLLLAVALISLAFPSPTNAAESFPDVPSTHWSFIYVSALTNKGLISGYTNGTFGPSRNITRAELVTIVIKSAFGSQPNGTSHWADNYMQKAVDSW